jgi:hypothetical protein
MPVRRRIETRSLAGMPERSDAARTSASPIPLKFDTSAMPCHGVGRNVATRFRLNNRNSRWRSAVPRCRASKPLAVVTNQ